MTGTSVDCPLMMSVCRSAALRETTTARIMRSSATFGEGLEGLFEHDGSPAMEISNFVIGFERPDLLIQKK